MMALVQVALCALHLALCVSSAFAVRPYTPVSPDPVLEPWRWRSFPELNGLGLWCMAEARDKAMWFGVNDGVRRYDGVKWTSYTEKDGVYGPPVGSLCSTRDGSIYAGTPLGISRFREGKWTRFFPPEGDLDWTTRDLMEARDGSLWSATQWGALRIGQDGATLVTTKDVGEAVRLLAPYVRVLVVPDSVARAFPYPKALGVLFMSSMSASTVPGRGDRPWVICALAQGGPGESAGLKVGDRITAVDGHLPPSMSFYQPEGPPVKLTVKRDGQATPIEVTVTRGPAKGAYRSFSVWGLCEDRQGAIWFGLYSGEILRYTPSTGPITHHSPLTTHSSDWRLYTEKDGLALGTAPRIRQTRDGTLWVISYTGKAVSWLDLPAQVEAPDKPWRSISLADIGGDNANSSIVETRDGTLWVGGTGHLYAFQGGRWRVYRPDEVEMPSHRTRLLETSDGALWVAGQGQEAARLDYGSSAWKTYEDLNYQCETPDGSLWFVSQDSGVVRNYGKTWTRYGMEDGLMKLPRGLLATRQGALWAFGSQDTSAATARLDLSAPPGSGGRAWTDFKNHSGSFYTILSAFESRDGTLWFSGLAGARGGGGVLRFDGKTWMHLKVYPRGLVQTGDGALWAGGMGLLSRFDGKTWEPITEPSELGGGGAFNDVVYAGLEGDLWVGTRTYGVFHHDPLRIAGAPSGRAWTRYDIRDGLADNSIQGILQTTDGSVWAVTLKGISRFDGRTWTTRALPLKSGRTAPNQIRQTRDGAIWLNGSTYRTTASGVESWIGHATRYQPGTAPPETEIILSLDKVSQPGNTVLAWTGASPWKATPDEEVQYSYRMDAGEWSPFSHEKNKVFLSLPSGSHSFEVRARDRDFNVDPTPASVRFHVTPPLWRHPWIIGLVLAFIGVSGFQASRIVVRGRRLGEANRALSSANKDLFGLNLELQEAKKEVERELAVDRIRAETATMQTSADIQQVIPLVWQELQKLGVVFLRCGVFIVDEPAGTLRIYLAAPDGRPLATLNIALGTHPMIDRVVEQWRAQAVYAEPWDRRSFQGWLRALRKEGQLGGLSDYLDPSARWFQVVPFSQGMLYVGSKDPLSTDHLELVGSLAAAFSAAYARHLDFVKLETQNQALSDANKELFTLNRDLLEANTRVREATERKSRFLANMSHDLRTPMNAIIGFTRIVLRRSADVLPERQRDNLVKVAQSADHLLNLINDILDLSKVEAGKLEIKPVRFGVKALIASCCATVNPLLKPGVELTHEVGGDVGEAHTDEARLRQILTNLLSNALKFTEKGEVRVMCHVSRATQDQLLDTPHLALGTHLVVAVSDTGVGIPPDALDTIFEEFSQIEGAHVQKGTGLGLSIAKKLTELLGGTIEVKSEVGKGSTFTVRIPMVYEEGVSRA